MHYFTPPCLVLVIIPVEILHTDPCHCYKNPAQKHTDSSVINSAFVALNQLKKLLGREKEETFSMREQAEW